MNDRISIIVPVHNAAKYLKENIDTILNQTYCNLEIIYVCDGCTDQTKAILRQYQKTDERIKILVNENNLGAAESRNRGMRRSKGEWLIFLDGDDVFEIDMLETMLDAAKKEQADMCCCYYNILNGTDIINRQVYNWKQNYLIDTYPVLEKKDGRAYLFQTMSNCAWNKLIKRTVICPDAGETLEFQNVPNSNDLYFSMSAAARAERIVFVDRNFVHYRSGNDKNTLSAQRNKKKTYVLCALDALYYETTKNADQDLQKSFYNKMLTEIRYLNSFVEKQVYSEVICELLDTYWEKWHLEQLPEASIYNLLDMEFYRRLKDGQADLDSLDQETIRQEKMLDMIKALKEHGLRIAVWGAGVAGKDLLERLEKRNIKVEYLIDRDSAKWGTNVLGYCVCDYKSVKEKTDAVIVYHPMWYDDIVKTIHDPRQQVINMAAESEFWGIKSCIKTILRSV